MVSLLPLLIITAEFSFSPLALTIIFNPFERLETLKKPATPTETPLSFIKNPQEDF